MIAVGDLVTVSYDGNEETLTGEIVNCENGQYRVYVLDASTGLTGYKNRNITVHCHSPFTKNKITKLSDTYEYQKKEELLHLIDLALDMNDRTWFNELTTKFNQLYS